LLERTIADTKTTNIDIPRYGNRKNLKEIARKIQWAITLTNLH